MVLVLMVLTFNGLIRISLSRKNLIPILLHVHNDPALSRRAVEGFVEGANVAFAVVGIHNFNHELINNHQINVWKEDK